MCPNDLMLAVVDLPCYLLPDPQAECLVVRSLGGKLGCTDDRLHD